MYCKECRQTDPKWYVGFGKKIEEEKKIEVVGGELVEEGIAVATQ